ncbi:MAG TPA: LysR family transcriptional regulator [Ramlibacter sp.]|nr:LysR family transcriptional regulator [Ramlibacter sp.]
MPDAASSLDLNLLRYLCVLVQEASVSRAAERLNVTQPAVSAALKRLREAFDDPILVRSGQVMAPTPRALDMAEQVAPMLSGVRELLERRGPFEADKARRSFTLMGSDYVQFFVLPRLAAQLAAAAPQVQLEHRPANPGKVEAWLQGGQVDLGIGYLATPAPALRSRLLFSDEQVCVIRRGHPAAKGPFTAERYAELTHVAVSPGGAGFYGARIDALLKSLGIRRRVMLTLPAFMAVPYVVAQTDHVATVPGRFARYFAGLLPLHILAPPLPFPAFEISLFWHERVHADLANAWLRQQVVEATREYAA